MRPSCLPLVLGVALACSGEPFTASPAPERSAGAGGQAGHSTTVTAGSGGRDAESHGGVNATAGQPEPPRGQAGAPSGAPAGGGGGEGGAGESTTPECTSASTSDWELGYFPELRDATTVESHPFFQVTNRGAPTTLDRIVIRYYFTKESPEAETAACYWVTGDRCSLAKLEFDDMLQPIASASRYLQISFPRASNVTVAGNFEVRVGFKTGSAPEVQTNDYSFDPDAAAHNGATPFPYKRWLKTTLYLDGKLVWGTEPCANGTR